MFTDTEIGLALMHRRRMNDLAGEAQGLINGQAGEIASLQRQLAACRQNGDLILERGRDRNEMIARRIAARRH